MKEPKLTKKQRKDVSKAFALVAKRLPITRYSVFGPSSYICDQLGNLAVTGHLALNIGKSNNTPKITDATASLCKGIVNARIDRRHSFIDWLKDQSEQIANEVRHDEEYNECRLIQAHRIAWCKMLAKEFAN